MKGKYGYIDDNGDLREVEYGATPDRGFEPRAEGLILPPPTVDVVTEAPVLKSAPAPVDDAAAAPTEPRQFANFAAKDSGRRVVVRKKLPIRGKTSRRTGLPARRPAVSPVAAPTAVPVRRPAPRPAFAVPQQPAALAAVNFDGHPARNIDLVSGSYSVSYSG